MALARALHVQEAALDDLQLDLLVKRGREGDPAAFDDLVGRFYSPLFRFCYRMLGSREAAEDVTQEVLIKAWSHLPRFRGEARFTTWLHTIAARECITLGRKRAREASRMKSPEGEAFSLPMLLNRLPDSTETADRETRLALQSALEKLPEPLRIVLLLHYYGEYSLKEIAEGLGVPYGTVYSRFRNALGRMNALVGEVEER